APATIAAATTAVIDGFISGLSFPSLRDRVEFGERKGEGLGWVSITLNYLLPRHRACPATPFFGAKISGWPKTKPGHEHGTDVGPVKSEVASALTIAAPTRWRRWSGFLKPAQRSDALKVPR